MIGKYRDVFDPSAALAIGNLPLLARRAVEGFVSGLHRSPHRAFAVEFAEHRPYSPGDEPRRIDWQAYARTDRYYVKLDEQQTNLRCQILLDASRSMAYASGTVSKFQYGRYLVALLGYLMLSQQDAVGLTVFDEFLREHQRPSAKGTSLARLFETLTAQEPHGATRLVPILHELAARVRQRGLIILVSDLLDEPQHVVKVLHHFVSRRHQVIVFHVMDPAELRFPFDQLTRFVDLEGAGRVLADPRQIRREYLAGLEAFLKAYRVGCADGGVEYVLADTAEPYDRMLVRYLAARRRLIK